MQCSEPTDYIFIHAALTGCKSVVGDKQCDCCASRASGFVPLQRASPVADGHKDSAECRGATGHEHRARARGQPQNGSRVQRAAVHGAAAPHAGRPRHSLRRGGAARPRPSLRQRPRPRGPQGPGCPFCAMKHGPQAHKLHRPVLCAALSPCSRSVSASCHGFCKCCLQSTLHLC